MMFRILAETARDAGLRESAKGSEDLAGRQSIRLFESVFRPRQELFTAEVAAHRARGGLLHSLRADYGSRLGGIDYPAVIVNEGVSFNGTDFTVRALEMLREGFEGAGFVVRRDGAEFGHLSESHRPVGASSDTAREEGFFFDLAVKPYEGKQALVGTLHVFEASVGVREHLRRELSAGRVPGLSVESPGPNTGKAGPARTKSFEPKAIHHWYGEHIHGHAEAFPVGALVTRPATGGRVLPLGTTFHEARRERAGQFIRIRGSLYRVPEGAQEVRLPTGEVVRVANT